VNTVSQDSDYGTEYLRTEWQAPDLKADFAFATPSGTGCIYQNKDPTGTA
jgi:hypothetical protein